MNCCMSRLLATLALAMLFSNVRAAVAAEVTWQQVQARSGTTTSDSRGDVLIVGGTTRGPSSRGGTAQWTTTIEPGEISRMRVTIYTNGRRFRGKGAHSKTLRGTVGIYINRVLVHNVVCDTRGLYGDYWPSRSPVGSSAYATRELDVSRRGIRGPTLTIQLLAKPYTAVDVNRIRISVDSEP